MGWQSIVNCKVNNYYGAMISNDIEYGWMDGCKDSKLCIGT